MPTPESLVLNLAVVVDNGHGNTNVGAFGLAHPQHVLDAQLFALELEHVRQSCDEARLPSLGLLMIRVSHTTKMARKGSGLQGFSRALSPRPHSSTPGS